MNLERLREHCLGFPGATEQVQWGADLVFKVGGKMFAVAPTVSARRSACRSSARTRGSRNWWNRTGSCPPRI
jgi:predicted DNA-binding protein (MmcQ/YjbR family)